jgi:hypothetical protein
MNHLLRSSLEGNDLLLLDIPKKEHINFGEMPIELSIDEAVEEEK